MLLATRLKRSIFQSVLPLSPPPVFTTAAVIPPSQTIIPRLRMPSPFLNNLRPTKKSILFEAAEKQMFRNVETPLEYRMVPISRKFMTDEEDKKQYYISTVSTVAQEGEDEKPDLLLVHGWGGAKGIWVRNIDDLAKHYRVHAIDLLGWGRSSRPRYCFGSDPAKAQKWWVKSLEAWRKEMGIEKFTLLGHSMGGFISASYALEYKDRLDKLILLSAIGLQGFAIPPQIHSMPLHTRLLFSYLWALTPQRILSFLPSSRVLRMLSSARSHTVRSFGFGDPDDTVMRYVYHLTTSTPVSGEVAFTKLFTPTKAWHLPLKDRLGELKGLDVAFVYGEHDWIDARFAVEEVLGKGIMDRAKIFVLAGAGHHGYVEKWAELNEIVMGSHRPEGCGVREFDSRRDKVVRTLGFSIA